MKHMILGLLAMGCATGSVARDVSPGDGSVASATIETPVDGSPSMAFRLMFYTGSVDDPAGKEGLTMLTARLIAEGGTKQKAYPELLRALYPMAGSIEAQVDKEQTVFYGSVHPESAVTFARMLAEVVLEPRLDGSGLERIRQTLISDIEKRLRATDDENLGKEMLNLMLYGGHPYGHYVGGTLEGLRAISLADVEAHRRRVFGRARLVIGVGGTIEPLAKAALSEALAALPEGDPRIATIPSVERPERVKVLIAEKPGKAVAISMGFPHASLRGHPDFSALALVQSYFGEHRQFHGVLMSEMREERGLNYGDYAYVENFIQEGWSRNAQANTSRSRQHFEIWIRPVDPKDAVFAIRLARHHLSRLVENGLTEAEVQDTATFLRGYTRLWSLTASRQLGHALDDQFYGTPDRLGNFRAELDRLNAVTVNAAIRKHLVAGPIHIAIVAPDAEALKKALVSDARSVKVYDAKVPDEVLREDEVVTGFPLGIAPEDILVMKAEELFVRSPRK